MPYYGNYIRLKRGTSYRIKKYTEPKPGDDTIPFYNTTEQEVLSSPSTSSGPAVYKEEVANISPDIINYGKTNSIFSFNRENILFGIIFSEILGEPRSRKYMRKR